MCYSAQILADYKRFVRQFGASVDIEEFTRLFWARARGDRQIRIPKAMTAAFEADQAVTEFEAAETTRLEQDLFKQRARLADAERKTTKKAAEDRRIATAKVEQMKGWLADLRRTDLDPRDARIFPGWYVPVLIAPRRLVPMRYQCRLPGRPESFDRQYPGTYNARRDNLTGFWRDLFGKNHAVMVADRFYEHVAGEVLEFEPDDRQPMLVACLWARSGDLLSFAAITDDPPAEVAAAGHDRCIIQIRPENLDAWLQPESVEAAQAILDDRPRPYYEHRLAA